VSQTIAGVRAIEIDTGKSIFFSNAECCFGYRRSIFNSTAAGKYLITGVTFRLKQNGAPAILYGELRKYLEGNRDITLLQVRDAVIAIRDTKGLLVREGHESFRSAGSFFRNPIVATGKFKEIAERVNRGGGCAEWAWPLDSGKVKIAAACLMQCAGYTRGFRKGNVGISPKHALIIINCGEATARDVIGFACEVQHKVRDQFGVSLSPELRLIGFPSSCLDTGDE
jgi:UDP-N-acetylmuramate dehydrogenase